VTDSSGRRWPWGIAAVLAITVVGNALIYWEANDADAAAVEPDYYRKAVEWDSTLAQGERNRVLGWSVEADLGPREPNGGRTVRVRLRDAAGVPVSGAAVGLTAIHNTYASQPVEARSVTDTAGDARMDVPLGHDGLWELRLAITRGADRYTATLRRDTASPDRAP
jgi:nitrogen fixation protein FixH